MTIKSEEIYQLIKLEDNDVVVALDKYNNIELETALSKLSEPIKLSFTQRMMARAFSIDVSMEISRFVRLIRETLMKKEAAQEVARVEQIEAGFLPQNLK